MRKWRLTATLLAGLCGAPQAASACVGPGSERTMFVKPEYAALVTAAPVALDITIRSISANSNYTILVSAHINRVIKGEVKWTKISMVIAPSSCDRGTGVGAQGVITGVAYRDEWGEPRFRPVFNGAYDHAFWWWYDSFPWSHWRQYDSLVESHWREYDSWVNIQRTRR